MIKSQLSYPLGYRGPQMACCSVASDSDLGLTYLLRSVYLNAKTRYGKCPKILYTKASDRMAYANGVDLDQTAPEEAVWSGPRLFATLLGNFRKQLHKKQNLGKKATE